MKIHIPMPLRQYAEKMDTVDVQAATVGDALAVLAARYPDLRRHLYTDEGKLRAFVNVYLNGEDIRYLQKESTWVKDSDTLSIVPSVAGGKDLRCARAARISDLQHRRCLIPLGEMPKGVKDLYWRLSLIARVGTTLLADKGTEGAAPEPKAKKLWFGAPLLDGLIAKR